MMNLKTAISLMKGGRLRLLWSVTRLFAPFYRLSFLAAAGSCGLLQLLKDSPRSLDEICAGLSIDAAQKAGLAAWLELGVRLKVLAKAKAQATNSATETYQLRGNLAQKLADPRYDEVSALAQEIALFHHQLIVETPERLRRGVGFTLAEHDGKLIARSSRILEPFVFAAIDWALPLAGRLHLLEVGCGAGTYMRYAAERSPKLQIVGIDLDPGVAEAARQAVASWGLARRISVEAGDIRARSSEPVFDVVTLYNSIYYFPLQERIPLLSKLASFLKPGGRLILSTSCRGGSLGMQVLDIWTSNTKGLGRLPLLDELCEQLHQAGFIKIESLKVVPGEPYYAFRAEKPLKS